jgi:hypothetical protein
MNGKWVDGRWVVVDTKRSTYEIFRQLSKITDIIVDEFHLPKRGLVWSVEKKNNKYILNCAYDYISKAWGIYGLIRAMRKDNILAIRSVSFSDCSSYIEKYPSEIVVSAPASIGDYNSVEVRCDRDFDKVIMSLETMTGIPIEFQYVNDEVFIRETRCWIYRDNGYMVKLTPRRASEKYAVHCLLEVMEKDGIIEIVDRSRQYMFPIILK